MCASLPRCTLVFHGALKEFLALDKSDGRIDYPLKRKASIKDIIESLGPPHTEVARIRSRQGEVDFAYCPSSGEVLWIEPPELPVNPFAPTRLSPEPLQVLRFLGDVNVGKTAILLRSLGYDTAYHWTWRDHEIAERAHEEKRIVLTKDIGLLKRNKVRFGRFLRSTTPEAQLREVLTVFGLGPPFALLSRCLRCNVRLSPVDKQAILHRLEPKTKRYFHSFSMCPECKRIYWAGSHQAKIIKRLEAAGVFSEMHTMERRQSWELTSRSVQDTEKTL